MEQTQAENSRQKTIVVKGEGIAGHIENWMFEILEKVRRTVASAR